MVDPTAERVLIAGISTRALATSAARAGYHVTAVDAFGDLDLQCIAHLIAQRRLDGARFRPAAAAAASHESPGGLGCYTSNFENFPSAVERLAQGRILLGNSASVLKRVRDPLLLMRRLAELGFSVPEARSTISSRHKPQGSWLLKPRQSGGGHGTRAWRQSQPVPRTHYLQQRLPGPPGSILFAADGQHAVVLGVTRQLVGDTRMGARGFQYCGSLLGSPAILFPDQPRLIAVAEGLASAVTREFGLRGLNGIDFIATDGVPWPIEVNPRYSASMELLERARALSIFQVHERACRGVLPSERIGLNGVWGKAVVFARRNVVMGHTDEWLDDTSRADIPHPGQRIQRGRPICTVFARGDDGDTCYARLVTQTAAVHRRTESGRQSAA